jgi:hypothetical protein
LHSQATGTLTSDKAVRASRKPAMGVAMTHKLQSLEDVSKDAKGSDEISREPGKSMPGR